MQTCRTAISLAIALPRPAKSCAGVRADEQSPGYPVTAMRSEAVKTLTAGDPVERRERRSVSMRGFALRADGETIEIVLLDLSYEGCGIETTTKLHRGEALKITVLGRCAIDTHVRWCRGGKAG